MGEGERCHWAWGYKCRLPDEAARRALAQRLGALFGTGDLLCRPLPALRDARIPEARIEPPANVPGSGGRVERACHTYGKSYFRSEFASAPDWVAYPESEAHIEELLAFCRARLAHYKCPKSIDFVDELPRTPTGKVRKRDIRQAYWAQGRQQIV